MVSITQAVASCKVARLKVSKRRDATGRLSQRQPKDLFFLGFWSNVRQFSPSLLERFGHEIRWRFSVSSGVHASSCCSWRQSDRTRQDGYLQSSQKSVFLTFGGRDRTVISKAAEWCSSVELLHFLRLQVEGFKATGRDRTVISEAVKKSLFLGFKKQHQVVRNSNNNNSNSNSNNKKKKKNKNKNENKNKNNSKNVTRRLSEQERYKTVISKAAKKSIFLGFQKQR